MTERRIITCREVIDFIADYLEDALPPESKSDFERHLALCTSCRAYLASYAATIRASRETMAADDAPEVPEELVQAILGSRR
jgi:anti-sigma factor RsiW